MARTWILVAESSRAKLYESNSVRAPLSELEDLVHPAGRMHAGDLVSDRAGTDGGSIGQGRHVMDDRTSAREHERIEFARQLAERLEAACGRGAFDRLVLVAPPAFLGLLRDRLSKKVMERVYRQIDKNLVQKPAEVVREQVSMAF
ncbi:MAG: host attachment protein [Gammaproteobacteria bacterium]|jgi:protein required for attachment to host cells